jgi:hypothetical protein
MNKEYYGVLFHYNTYTNKWNCFERDCFNDYFNGVKKSRFGRGKNESEAFKNWLKKKNEVKEV